MTPPKDKAKELFKEMKFCVWTNDEPIDDGEAKQCALISQQEKIDLLEVLDKQMQSVLGTDGHEERDFITAHLEYENQVKIEIQKL